MMAKTMAGTPNAQNMLIGLWYALFATVET